MENSPQIQKMANQIEEKKTRRQKMKVLQTSQKYFAILGISSEQSIQENRLNRKLLMGSILLGHSFVTRLVYLIYLANSFDKYIECICSTIAVVVITTCFVSMVFRMSILYECIDNIENLIETSKYNGLFRSSRSNKTKGS